MSFLGPLRHSGLALAGLGIVAAIALLAAFASLIATHSPVAADLGGRLQPPSAAHFLGTDELGRDIWSRLLFGARATLGIVALVAAATVPLGLVVGMTAGYFGGRTDAILMRMTDVFLAFPRLVLALALAAALGPGLVNAVAAIALTSWPPYARLARAEAMILRERDFVAAARLAGASHGRILRTHVLPLVLPGIVVRASLDLGGTVLVAAGLGFLGLGMAPPAPEWGAMVSAGRQVLLDHYWVATFPGAAILVLALGFNLLGDGLRDVLDPRQR